MASFLIRRGIELEGPLVLAGEALEVRADDVENSRTWPRASSDPPFRPPGGMPAPTSARSFAKSALFGAVPSALQKPPANCSPLRTAFAGLALARSTWGH